MNVYLMPFFGIILLALTGVIGDFFIKLASGQQNSFLSKWFFIGIIIYGLTAFGWVWVMKSVKLSTLGIVYAISTALLLLFMGTFYFKEKLYPYEILGIILGLLSIILLGRYR